jgi:hypothetical protein
MCREVHLHFRVTAVLRVDLLLLVRIYRVQTMHWGPPTLDFSAYSYPYHHHHHQQQQQQQQQQEEYSTWSQAALFLIPCPLMTQSFYDVVWATDKVVPHHKNTFESYHLLRGFSSDRFPRTFSCKILYSLYILLSLLQTKPSLYSNKHSDWLVEIPGFLVIHLYHSSYSRDLRFFYNVSNKTKYHWQCGMT